MFKFLGNSALQRNCIIVNCKRKYMAERKSLPYDHYEKFPSYVRLFKKKFNYDRSTARQMVSKNQYLLEVPQEDILKVYNICKAFAVDMKSLPKNPRVLALIPELVKHRIMLLEEMGVIHIPAILLSKYDAAPRTRMALFKAAVDIPESANVAENMIQSLGPLPPNVPPMEPLSDHLTVKQYRSRCLEWYLRWRLNLTDDDEELIKKGIPILQHRSFRLMEKQIQLLYDELELTGTKILRESCLLRGSAEELKRSMEAVKTFGGIDIKKLIRVQNGLHKMEYNNVVKVKKLVEEEHGFSDKMIRLYPRMLILPHKELVKRLEILDNTPELRVLKRNVRALVLLRRLKTVLIRLEFVRYHGVKHLSVRFLAGHERYFERTIRGGLDNTLGKEIGLSLEKQLNLDAKEIVRRIKEHPFWRRVGLIAMHDTTEYLLQQFSPEDINQNIQLILYSKEKIAEVLEKLPEMNEDAENRLPDKQILAICLYEIEKEYHFSGDGIWLYNTPEPNRIADPANTELSEFSDSEESTDTSGKIFDEDYYDEAYEEEEKRRIKNQKKKLTKSIQ